MGELVDRPAIELARGDKLVTGLEQGMEHERLRRVAGGDRKRRGAAFERRDPLLQHRLGRIGDARIDVAERLEIEQSGGMLNVVEDKGRGLINRRGARARRGVGLRAGMNGKRVEARRSLCAHSLMLLLAIVDGDDLVARGHARAGIAEVLEPDIAAAFADHEPLIVLEIGLRVLGKDRGF